MAAGPDARALERRADRRRFAEALTRARERSGLSREDLARRVAVSHMTVRRWESGATVPNVRNYTALVAVVGALQYDALVRFEEISRRIALALSEIAPAGCSKV